VRQEINLYQPIFRRPRPLFSARAMGRALLLMVVSLAGMYGYAAWEVEGLQRYVAGLERQRERAQTRLLALEKNLPAREPSRLLATEVERLARNVEQREALVAMLSAPGEASGEGFSAHLEGLARQHVQGLWLTGIRLEAAGQEVIIRGSALDAALVPVLVQRLGEEQAFAGMRFAALTIDRTSDAPEQVDFELRTRNLEQEEADGQRR